MSVTIAASVATNPSNLASIGGAINVINTDNEVSAIVGKKAELTAETGDIEVSSMDDAWLLIVPIGAAMGGKVAGALSIAAIITSSEVNTLIDEEAVLVAGNDIRVLADSKMWLLNTVIAGSLNSSGSGAAIL